MREEKLIGMEMTRFEESPEVKQLSGILGPGVLTTIESKLGFASREDYVIKSFDGRLVNVLLPLVEKAKLSDVHDAITWCIKQKSVERGGEGIFITKNFYKKEKLYEAVERFSRKERRSRRHMECLKRAKTMLLETLKSTQSNNVLTPYFLTKEMELKDNLSTDDTSCGIIASGSKQTNKDMIIDLALRLSEELPEYGIPALAITRQQMGKYVDEDGNFTPLQAVLKERLVWCVDAATVLFESMFARPFINEILIHQTWYAGGMNDQAILSKLNSFRDWKPRWISIDFSDFDSTIPSWLIAEAFDIVKEFFPKQYWSQIGWIANQFIHTKILMPDGNVYDSNHGIPSGSYFTQIIGSIVNALIQLSYQFTINDLKAEKVKENIFSEGGVLCASFMGDDSILFSNIEVDEKDFSRYVENMFGMKCHPLKCSKGESLHSDPEYLKRTWTSAGADRNLLDLVINMIHPERKREYLTYAPYHLIYSYYLSYPVAMKRLGIEEDWLLRKMREHGGVGKLLMIPTSELPGSIRVRVLNNYDEWQRIVEQAVTLDNKMQQSVA